jgi:type II secretory pathway component PulC
VLLRFPGNGASKMINKEFMSSGKKKKMKIMSNRSSTKRFNQDQRLSARAAIKRFEEKKVVFFRKKMKKRAVELEKSAKRKRTFIYE